VFNRIIKEIINIFLNSIIMRVVKINLLGVVLMTSATLFAIRKKFIILK